MSLAIDTTPIHRDDRDTEVSMVEDWLRTTWGIRPGAGSPRCSAGTVHPSCLASAGWLTALYGFSV